MDYKPGDVFVGVVDFFSILLPGAVLCFLFLEPVRAHVLGSILPEIRGEAEGWVAFVLASYLAGQFVSLIGAAFMDDIYDKTYLAFKRGKKTKHGSVAEENAKLTTKDPTYAKAKEIEGKFAGIAGVLKWARAHVQLRNPGAALEMDRLEGTSKFFRSFALVLLVYAFSFAICRHLGSAGVCLALAWFSFWRFSNQRWKFTELAYIYFIQLNVYGERAGPQA